MDPTSSSRDPAHAVEARPNGLARASRTGSLTTGCPRRRSLLPKLVENGSTVAARRHARRLLRSARPLQARPITSTFRTARCGPACRMVWQGNPRDCLGPLRRLDALSSVSCLRPVRGQRVGRRAQRAPAAQRRRTIHSAESFRAGAEVSVEFDRISRAPLLRCWLPRAGISAQVPWTVPITAIAFVKYLPPASAG